MRGELPSLKRCCLCFPLRRGLIFWGYFKLVTTGIVLYPMVFYLMYFINVFIFGRLGFVINFFISIVLLLDLAFNIVLVIAGHMKNHQLFRVYYFYTIIFTSIFVALSAIFCIFVVLKAQYRDVSIFVNFPNNPFMNGLISVCLYTFAFVVLQLYIILLVRSETLKLQNEGIFRFVNNEGEAECTLNMILEPDYKKINELNTEKEYNNDKV